VRLEGLGQLKKIHLIGTRTHDLLACRIVPQPTALPRDPYLEPDEFIPHTSIILLLFSHQYLGLPNGLTTPNAISQQNEPFFAYSPSYHKTVLAVYTS
jgi:hypothetical protein